MDVAELVISKHFKEIKTVAARQAEAARLLRDFAYIYKKPEVSTSGYGRSH